MLTNPKLNRIIAIICAAIVILVIGAIMLFQRGSDSESANESESPTIQSESITAPEDETAALVEEIAKSKLTEGEVTEGEAQEAEAQESEAVVESEPAASNHSLKIVTGDNQWEGASINCSNIPLEVGRKYEFSLNVFTPDLDCGILVQHTDVWIHIINSRFDTPDVKEWRSLAGTFDTSSLDELFNLQITKAGDSPNFDSKVTFYIDDFKIVDADTQEVVFFDDFENKTTKIDNSSATISIVPESVIHEVPEEKPLKGEYALDVTPLKDIYKDYFLIGSIVNPSDFGDNKANKERYEVFKHHYNAITFENSMKPDAMWGNGNSYDAPTEPPSFDVDKYIKTMIDDGITVIGHTLTWHGQSPNWLNLAAGDRSKDTAVYKTYAEANANLKNFITTVAGHYYNNPDGLSIYSWDVLNEAVRRTSGYPMTEEAWGIHTKGHIYASPQWNSPWYLAYSNETPEGVNPWDYVYDAFLYARQADPSTILYYNDYGMDDQSQSTMVVNMVNAVNKRYALEHPEANGRLLIEGIGMQEHDGLNTSLINVEKSIQKFITTGCIISITELDVGVPGYKKGDTLSEADEIKQGLYFAKLFNLFKKYSDHIERVSFWGLDDAHSWRPNDLCLVFDGDLRTKLAYDAIADPDAFIAKYEPQTN